MTEVTVSDSELGVWFGIDGAAIKNQPQLDLAVVALAGLYGYKPEGIDLDRLHELVHTTDEEELCDPMVSVLIWECELAIRHLNKVFGEAGYRFDFTGDEYQFLNLRKL